MDMMDDDNLFYLKNSGLYKIGDVAFSVFSILDDPKNYISYLDIEDTDIKTKIAGITEQ